MVDEMKMKDPYEDQLSAARFKAERDVALQEIDRMRPVFEWVEAHGGLPHVKDIYNDFRAVVERLGVEWSESELHGLMDVLDRRLLPEGMEWPRYEDGEPVRIGDEFADGGGNTRRCTSIEILHGEEGVFDALIHWSVFDPFAYLLVNMWLGERVKRPEPKVLDADGVEIRVGDEVWDVDGSGPFIVSGFVGEPLAVIFEIAECNDLPRKPSQLTHRAPVLGADNKPLREGETVWHVETGSEFRVLRTPRSTVKVDVTWREGFEDKAGSVPPQKLTHERPDSWERLEEDADALVDAEINGEGSCSAANAYCNRRGLGEGTSFVLMAQDLVRRARALADRGQ